MLLETHASIAIPAGLRLRLGAMLLASLGCNGCGVEEGATTPPPGVRGVDVQVTQTRSTDSIATGQQVTFHVTVTNRGPGEVPGIIGGDTLTSGLQYLSHSIVGSGSYDHGTRVWTIGHLPEGGSSRLTIVARALANANATYQSNLAGVMVGSEVFDTVPSNNGTAMSVRVADAGSAPPPPAGVTFESTWSSALGTANTAWSDNSRWDISACSSIGSILTVIPGAEVGFTETANVLRMQMRGESCGTIQRTNAVPTSTSHWGRFYVRNDEHGTRNDHTMAYNNIHGGQGIQAVPFARYAQNFNPRNRATLVQGEWLASVIIRFPYPYGRWYSPVLAAGRWYRYEYHFEYQTPTMYRIWPRIYDMSGTLLYDADDFLNEDSRQSLAGYYDVTGANRFAELGVLNTDQPNAAVADNIGIGNEGPAGNADTRGYWYYAKFALSTSGWLGR